MRLKRLSTIFSATVLTMSSLLGLGFAPFAGATANNCTWTGASTNNFNTAGNWSSCNSTVPQSGDNLVFDNTSLSADTTLTNDISSLSVGTISFSGSGQHVYTITGNAVTVGGGIAVSANDYGIVNVPLTLGADQTFSTGNQSGLILGDSSSPSTITLGSHALTLTSGANSCTQFLRFNDALSGSGSITDNATIVTLNTDSPNYTGAVTVSGGRLYANTAAALGSGTGSTTVASGASLIFGLSGSNETINEPLSLSGSGYGSLATLSADVPYAGGCSGGGPNGGTATLTGTIALQTDIVYGGSLNTNITGTYTSNGHAITVSTGAAGTITTPDGTVSAPAVTNTVAAGDNDSSQSVDVGNKVTEIIDGTRGATFVDSGGILKGSGTVGVLTVASGGIVAPGHSPGCLSSGNLNIVGTYQAEIGGTDACTGYDQLKVTGTVTLSGTLDTSLYNGFKPAKGQSYTIIDNDGSDAVSGTFTGLAEGATFTVDGYVLGISYVGGDGNDVVLTVKSVPAAPNTGFGLIAAHPQVTLLVTLLAAGTIVGIAQRTRKSTARR